MNGFQPKSIRPFLGAQDYRQSRNFYAEMGFEEFVISDKMSVFKGLGIAFYLQNYYVKEWMENLMVFLEVADVDLYWQQLKALGLPERYPTIKIMEVQQHDWGKAGILLDPSGILWHVGELN